MFRGMEKAMKRVEEKATSLQQRIETATSGDNQPIRRLEDKLENVTQRAAVAGTKVLEEAQEALDWEKKAARLKDVKFHQVDMTKWDEKKSAKLRVLHIISIILIFKVCVDVVIDVLYVANVFQATDPQTQKIGIAYTVFAVLGWIVLGRDIYDARKVVKSDDVSDAFTNNLALSWHKARSFSKMVFFREVSAVQKKIDKAAMWIFLTLRDWPRTLLVKIPLFVLAIVTTVNGLEDSTAAGDTRETATLVALGIIKTILVMTKVGALMMAVSLYPCVKMLISCASLRSYASYRVEIRLNELLFGDEEEGVTPDDVIVEEAQSEPMMGAQSPQHVSAPAPPVQQQGGPPPPMTMISQPPVQQMVQQPVQQQGGPPPPMTIHSPPPPQPQPTQPTAQQPPAPAPVARGQWSQ